MFDIRKAEDGSIVLSGRFDASQVATAQALFDTVTGSATVDFTALEYISSAGLGVLLGAHKRLSETGAKLKLRGLKKLVRDVFRYSRLDTIFEIEEG
jgi:anti-sigma B factor antagonist